MEANKTKKRNESGGLKHKMFYNILRPLVILFLKAAFGYRYKKAENLPENYIVLSNHVTDFDPLFVGASFNKQMYFVASEHISRWGFAYTLLKYVFTPILRYKGTVATSTVFEVLRKVKNGENVCIFAEGIRSWDGVSSPVLPSTGKMVKSAKCGLVTYKIVGGYFASPNWAGASIRRGYVSGAPVNVFTKEQLAEMSAEEINRIIVRDLYEDAYERQLKAPEKYRCRRPAEHLENLLFLCPHCGGHDTLRSKVDTVSCSACGAAFKYDLYGMLSGVPFKTVRDFSNWQKERVAEHAAHGVEYRVPSAKLSTIAKQQETLVAEGMLSISPEAIVCGDVRIALDDIMTMDIHGRHELVFNVDKDYYELVPSRDYNAMQFLLYFNACKAAARK